MTHHDEVPKHVISQHIAVPVQRVWDEITTTGRVQRAMCQDGGDGDRRD